MHVCLQILVSLYALDFVPFLSPVLLYYYEEGLEVIFLKASAPRTRLGSVLRNVLQASSVHLPGLAGV